MEVIITMLFIMASLLILRVAQKATNPIALIHIAFFIMFVELLHFERLFEENEQHYDIVYYLLTHLSVLLYLGIFALGMLWLRERRLIPPQEKLFNAAINIGNVWLIAAFCGWILIKAYLVTRYGVSAFSVFRHLAGKDVLLHYTAWWETLLEVYLRDFAMGASVIYVVKAVMERGYWKVHWVVSLSFIAFASIYIGTHSSVIGPRRFILMLFLVALVTAAWKEGKAVTLYLFSRWRKVLVAVLVLFSAAAYYQSIRNNFFKPEIANKLLSGDLLTFSAGVVQGLVSVHKDDRNGKVAFFRSGPLDIIYKVIERRNDYALGTDGKITSNSFRMVIPRVIAGKNKEDINADDYLEQYMSISPDGPYLVSDVATSLLAIFMADFGFVGVLIAPMVIVFSLLVFLHIPRKGLLYHPLMVLFLFSVLLNLAANVEGDLVAILSTYRNAIILGIVLLPLKMVLDGVILKNKSWNNRKYFMPNPSRSMSRLKP